MRQTWAIARRDLGGLFGSPVAYIVILIFAVLTSWLFVSNVFIENTASMQSFLGNMPFIMLFILPAMAMRSFAEERKAGTFDLLLSMPLRDWQLVIGKYLALLIFWAAALLLTLNIPITLVALGQPDIGQVFASYLATFLTGAAMLAVSLACSVMTENQIIAFILGVAACFILLIIGSSFVLLAVGPWLGVLLERLSLLSHFDTMSRGIIDLRDLYYFAALIAAALAFVLTMLESRKWR